MIEFILKDIKDEYIRENFTRLSAWMRSFNLINPNWKFFEITFTGGLTNHRYPHRLGYMPKDIIVTSVSNGGSVVFNYDLFNKDYLDLSVSGACTVRFFAGTYRGTA